MLLLTVGAVVIMGCMAVSRACGGDLVAAAPAMGVIVALFGFGRFTPLDGFPNYAVAVVAAAVAISLMIRPTLRASVNFFTVAGMGLIVAYNWYPLLLLMAPALIVASVRARANLHGRARSVMTIVIVATAVAIVLPATTFAHRGVSWLDVNGTLPLPPWGLVIACIAALLLVALVRQSARSDYTTNLIIGLPAALAGIAVISLVAYTSSSAGAVTYYGVKISAGMLGVCLALLAMVLGSDLAASKFRRSLPQVSAGVMAAILTIAVLQIDGYVGPASVALKSSYTAPGINVRDELVVTPGKSEWTEQVLLSAELSQGRSGGWWYVDPRAFPGDTDQNDHTPNDPALMAEWFEVLRGDPSNTAYSRGVLVGAQIEHPLPRIVDARDVIQDFPDPLSNHIHLFVPQWLKASMVHDDPLWGRPGLLYVIPTPSSRRTP